MSLLDQLSYKCLNFSKIQIIVFIILATLNLHSSTNPTLGDISTVSNLIGQIGLALWIYEIAYKSNQILLQEGIYLILFRNFKVVFIIMSISYFSLFSLSFIDPTILATVSDLEREKPFTYIKIIYALVFILVTSVIYIWRSAAKLLVSEENGEEKSFGDYFSTLFLLITPFIGVWYIHPRIKNLYSNFQTN